MPLPMPHPAAAAAAACRRRTRARSTGACVVARARVAGRRLALALALAAGARSTVARADSLVSLPDLAYADQHPAQRSPLHPRIHQIIYPTLGLPALVAAGGTFDVFVRGVRDTDAAGWRVVLRTDDRPEAGPLLEVRPTSVDVDPAARLTRLHVAVPTTAPRDAYHLDVVGPGGLVDHQPRAVRVLGAPRTDFRFAMMSDHQLWDPSWKGGSNERNAGDYPRRGEADANRAAARQGWHELELADPEFVLYGGDLVFGLDYPAETDEAYRLWSRNRFATFFVPGNHDGYARYEVRLHASATELAIGAARCRPLLGDHLRDLSFQRAFSFVACAYKDVRRHLFHDLIEDGLAYYQTMFGPPFYSFDYGALHVIAVSSYGGTPERRHSFSIYVDLFDLHLGAPAVDNYGGYLTDAALDWIERDARAAREAGKTVLVFMHHDPRGNLEGIPESRYHDDKPFPTDPISLEGFEEWNYDDPAWPSDPSHPRAERKDEHSGIRLCRILARYADHVLLGHRHADEHRVYEPGDEIAPGVRAQHRMEWVRVTAAAGAPHGDGYWGYRLFQVHEGGKVVDLRDYDYAHALGSVPEGNLWATPAADGRSFEVVNALPHPADVTLRFPVEARPEGWRFVEAGTGYDLPVREVAPLAGGRALYYVRYEAPAGGLFPPRPGGGSRRVVRAVPATGNHPPRAVLTVTPETPAPGEPVVLSAASSTDPDGDPLIAWRWRVLGGEPTAPTSTVTFPAPGSYSVALDVTDGRGAVGRVERVVTVVAPPPPPPDAGARPPDLALPPSASPAVVRGRGCGCAVGARPATDGAGGAVALLVAALGAAVLRRRESRGDGRVTSPMETPRMPLRTLLAAALVATAAVAVPGCATVRVIPGTTVADTKVNQQIVRVCEEYRRALEDRDAEKLLSLAHPRYFEDSGTPAAADDYGYDGLKKVLYTRLSALRSVRYNIEYRSVDVAGNHARVDIRYDASFQIATAMGDRWERKQNDKRIELEREGTRWLIIAGM